jgi:DNA polymerase elongation subunit (family B)
MSGKQLSNVLHVRDRDDNNRQHSKIIYVESVLQPDGTIKKQFEIEEEPSYTFYITKDEHRLSKAANFIEFDKVEPINVKFDNLQYEMAKASDQMDFYKACRNNGKWRELRNLHKDNNLHLTDMDLADYKTREWLDRNRHNIAVLPITKAFYDIEVDVSEYKEFPEPELAPCPVSMISYIHQPTMTIHSFILRNPNNQSQMDFLDAFEEYGDEWISQVIDEMNEKDPNSKVEYAKVRAIEVHIFDDEGELLKAFFNVVKRDKPDFMGAWNAGFDLVTMKNRMLRLKLKPEEIMCPKELPYKSTWIENDTFATDFTKRNTKLDVAGYSQYVEMQEQFAKIRATMGKRESYSLDAILIDEGIEGKYDYEGEITDAMYINYESFLKYSMYDSFRLYQLEEQNNDIDLLYNMGLMTATRFNKVMTKTTSIRNFAAMVLEKEGFLLSNNHNRLKEEEEKKKFKGAFVALPEMMDAVGIVISKDGKRSNRIFENIVDEDLSSMYPSIILAGNIDADTMIGKIMCDKRPELDDIIPGLIAENDIVRIGKELLGLPDVNDVIRDLEELLA